MKKEARLLLSKSIDSLIISIEHFNRPWDRGREETVLILMDRSFELLLKSIIVFRGGKIREARAKETIGFDKCVRKCLSDEKIKCLTENQALTIQIINSLRDAAQHYILDISEQQLYMYAQAGVSLYSQIINDVFSQSLSDCLPERVLPISTHPPKDLHSLISFEFNEIKKLAAPKSRKLLQARAKLRSLAIIEASLRGLRSQPGESELTKILHSIQNNTKWEQLFPGVASLHLDTKGTGLAVSIRLTKREGEAVHLVPEGTPGATIIAVKKVDPLGYYNLGLYDLSKKLSISPPKLLAVIKELKLQEDPDMFKIIKIGKSEYKRYSQKTLKLLEEEINIIKIEDVWKKHRAKTF